MSAKYPSFGVRYAGMQVRAAGRKGTGQGEDLERALEQEGFAGGCRTQTGAIEAAAAGDDSQRTGWRATGVPFEGAAQVRAGAQTQGVESPWRSVSHFLAAKDLLATMPWDPPGPGRAPMSRGSSASPSSE